MNIYDLTNGEYQHLFKEKKPGEHIEELIGQTALPSLSLFMYLHGKDGCYSYRTCRAELKPILGSVPIFLVESSMAGQFVKVPGLPFSIKVPIDKVNKICDDDGFDINEWVRSKEYDGPDESDEKEPNNVSISDLLGVYVHCEKDDLAPQRIFVWMDKIKSFAIENTQMNENASDNEILLFELVLLHEIGHALMDVEMHGVRPSPRFSYENDYVYRYIEEAFANCFALTILFSEVIYPRGNYRDDYKEIHKKIFLLKESFIGRFVQGQGAGYSDGWRLFEGIKFFLYYIDSWMCIKTLFNYGLAEVLRKFWNGKDYHFIDCFKDVGRDNWLAVKTDFNKYYIMDISTRKRVFYFDFYDYFGNFEDGLSIVREDNLYGGVDEQGNIIIPIIYDWISYEGDGVAIIKKDGKYGVISKDNRMLAPCKMSSLDSARGLIKRAKSQL